MRIPLVFVSLLMVGTAAWPANGSLQDLSIPADLQPIGIAKVITVLVTQMSSGRVDLDVIPRTIEISPGETVLWVNAVPESIARVVFDENIPSGKACGTPKESATPSSGSCTSNPIGPGAMGAFRFDSPGTYTYRILMSSSAGVALLKGQVVVR
jgi:plastocyanin